MTHANLPIQTLCAQQVAQILNCSTKTVLEKAGSGELRGAKIGKAWVFRLEDIDIFITSAIERQTEVRKNRYTPSDVNQSQARSYSGAKYRQRGYPDLSQYRELINT